MVNYYESNNFIKDNDGILYLKPQNLDTTSNTISYTPFIDESEELDYSQVETLKSLINSSSILPELKSTDVSDIVNYKNLLIYILAYLEGNKYPESDIKLSDLYTISFDSSVQLGGDKVTLLTYIIKSFTYTLDENDTTVTTEKDNYLYILKDFDYEDYIINGGNYIENNTGTTSTDNIYIRGFNYVINTCALTKTLNPGIIYGGGYNSIPAFCIAQQMMLDTNILILLNIPTIFFNINSHIVKNYCKYLFLYSVDNYSYQFPSIVYGYQDDTKTTYTSYTMSNYNLDEKCVNGHVEDIFEITVSPKIAKSINSIYDLWYYKQLGSTINNAKKSLGYTFPKNITPPTDISTNDNKKALREMSVALNFPNETTVDNIKKSCIDRHISGYVSNDGNLYLTVYDSMSNEKEVSSNTDFKTFSIVSPAVSYQILKECDFDYTNQIDNVLTNLEITLQTPFSTGKVFIYSFGYHIHSFIRDIMNSTKITTSKDNFYVYVEGLAPVCKGFLGFEDTSSYNLKSDQVKIVNIWGDMPLNLKVPYDGEIDYIQAHDVYDPDYTDTMIGDSSLVHSVFAYDLLITF